MRYGIFGDIHGNIEAFKKVIEAYKKENIDKHFCVGDIVGYGANPSECIEEIKRLKAKTVCGNHDWAAAGIFPLDGFNPAAKNAIEWTQKNLTSDDKQFLKDLKPIHDEKDFSIVHGSLYESDLFPYTLDTEAAYRCFIQMKKELCFVGHSHIAGFFSMKGNLINYSREDVVKIESGIKYIIDVGSIGQPRGGNPKATFCIFDTDKSAIEIKRVQYDIDSAKIKIIEAGLPQSLG